MFTALAAIALGLALLVWGADRFVLGASALARNLGVSPLLIGLTVVGFGTSAPEILVSITASSQGNPGLAIGNAIGSNIANIGLILGTTALITPLLMRSEILRGEYLLLLAVSVCALLLLSDGQFSRFDGGLLLGGILIATLALVRLGQGRSRNDPLASEFDAEIPRDMSTLAATSWLALGLLVLLISSRMLVWGAVYVAQTFGVSDLVIGLTIVAIGTSLPELAASVMSAFKGEPDIAIGNVIGSNLYNLLAVLGIAGVIAPSTVTEDVISRDLPVMLALTILLYLLGRGHDDHGHINRTQGGLLLATFIAYQGWLLYTAQSTDALS